MFKLLAICISLCVATQAFTMGGYQPATVTDDVLSLAKWSASQLSGFTNLEGEHTVMTVRNLKIQIVNGVNYQFTVDLLVQTPENQYFVSDLFYIIFNIIFILNFFVCFLNSSLDRVN